MATTAPSSFHPATAAAGPRAGTDAAPPAQQAPAAGSRAAQKGQQTRAAILDAALSLASQMGLEGLSIGALAEVMHMSKSGVFAHFGSREELQISVIREYHARFEEEVFFPAIREPRGLPRLTALFERWIHRVSVELDSGCIYISGAVEFDDRPGPVRDALATMVRAWHAALERAIRASIEAGHLRADADAAQMLFEIHGLILALHHDWRFLRNAGVLDRARTGFERVIAFYRPGGEGQTRAAQHAIQQTITKRPAAAKAVGKRTAPPSGAGRRARAGAAPSR
ncbi:MAG: TetR/AcrR family transcriptional regulator [Burkholderiales bacterium]|nr:TetR/AcrR family transcriptional regulator [Burkholderiales bacterium]